MKRLHVLLLLLVFLSIPTLAQEINQESFGYAAKQLKTAIDDIVILKNDKSMIAVSPSYQARVFTSTTNGNQGKSRGWINWELLNSGKHKDSFAYLGGESRFWLAPEFGAFSIFFDPEKEMTIENMRAPKDLDSKKFIKTSQNDHAITAVGTLKIQNAKGHFFDCGVERTVTLFTKNEIQTNLKINLHKNIDYVGFSAETILKNIGSEAWQKDKGLLSIWELSCMLTSPKNQVIIPVQKNAGSIKSYFSQAFTKDVLVKKGDFVYFKANALHLSKLGIAAEQAKNIIGSYSPELNLLNIVTFSFDRDATTYVNSIPGNKSPYSGDVINVFNGEINKEKNYNWPFYEFESSSSTKELGVGEALFHKQTLYHFKGAKETLSEISNTVLGVDLTMITF